MSDKEKQKNNKKRAYRIIIITIAFLMALASVSWLPFVDGIHPAVPIAIGSTFAVAYVVTIILVEISYSKRNKGK